MIRKIIRIDEEKCNGCGLCAKACHEGAIGMVEGKAKLLREDYCDGLGDCLPACPTGAIAFEEREALAYDEAAVKAAKGLGCPGTRARELKRADAPADTGACPSMLTHWPVQIKLVSPNASCFNGADLLIAADCTAYAYGSFHRDFIKNRVCIIGCPKLDMVDYREKLTDIIANNDLRSLTVVRMEVPCCGGIEIAAREALKASGKSIPLEIITISINGEII